ncbi:hypothetical protein DMB68_03610 [Flavobacterium hydrophilum]|uniref:Uncharacterized protein n=1 Tax=Flavobacterium hydrophilum TaxID=2211445 RepID=A0A2V4C4K8_9FLAO|nr:hypothetical protein DMB68_03610 [Flavobacterium hydrophilum]
MNFKILSSYKTKTSNLAPLSVISFMAGFAIKDITDSGTGVLLNINVQLLIKLLVKAFQLCSG